MFGNQLVMSSAVQDTAIVDKGKNVVSVSKDGTARLWHCGAATCIAILCQHDAALNCCCIGRITDGQLDLSQPQQPVGELT